MILRSTTRSIDKAMRLCRQVNETSSPVRPSSVAAAAMETAFRQRVEHVASLDTTYQNVEASQDVESIGLAPLRNDPCCARYRRSRRHPVAAVITAFYKGPQKPTFPGLENHAHWRHEDSGKMQHEKNRPIFVVGSPRSGTSILTWCLGQHPNIIPLEESGWMGDFAIEACNLL